MDKTAASDSTECDTSVIQAMKGNVTVELPFLLIDPANRKCHSPSIWLHLRGELRSMSDALIYNRQEQLTNSLPSESMGTWSSRMKNVES